MGNRAYSIGTSLAMAMAAFGLGGCLGIGEEGGQRGVQVRPELVRAEGKATAKRAAPAPGTVLADPDFHWSSAVDITSLKVPIRRISLHNAAFDHEADLYTCEGGNDACQIEMAGTAFQDALNAAPHLVEMGQYDYVTVSTCTTEGEYRTGVTGTVTLDGKTWYTRAAGVLDTLGPAEAVSVTSSGCGRTYALPHPLRVTDSLGAQVDFKLYFDIQDLAYAALGSRKTAGAWTPGNCAGDRPADTDAPSPPFLCIGYPDVSGIIDTAAALLERYRINGGATVGLFFTADDAPIGGYTRNYFTEGVAADPGFTAVMPLRDVRKNPDGTLYVDGFGPAGHAYDLDQSVFRAAAFARATHAGSFTATQPDGSTATHTYSAERLSP